MTPYPAGPQNLWRAAPVQLLSKDIFSGVQGNACPGPLYLCDEWLCDQERTGPGKLPWIYGGHHMISQALCVSVSVMCQWVSPLCVLLSQCVYEDTVKYTRRGPLVQDSKKIASYHLSGPLITGSSFENRQELWSGFHSIFWPNVFHPQASHDFQFRCQSLRMLFPLLGKLMYEFDFTSIPFTVQGTLCKECTCIWAPSACLYCLSPISLL